MVVPVVAFGGVMVNSGCSAMVFHHKGTKNTKGERLPFTVPTLLLLLLLLFIGFE